MMMMMILISAIIVIYYSYYSYEYIDTHTFTFRSLYVDPIHADYQDEVTGIGNSSADKQEKPR